MSNFTLRPVQPGDYEPLAEAACGVYPGLAISADELIDEDADNKAPGLKYERWVAEVDGRAVGTAVYWQSMARFHPQKFWMEVFVHPDHQRRGIGTALYNRLMASLAAHNPVSVRGATREDLAGAMEFLVRRGFQEAKRTWRSEMDVTTFDAAAQAGGVERVLAQGIRIATMAELQADPTWDEKYLALYNAIQTDVPDIDPATTVTMEQFKASRLDSPRRMPEAEFIALDGDRWVGMSTYWRTSEPDKIDIGLTGTLAEYRRRGIAMALKLKGIEFAKANGVRAICTANASTNVGMLAVNQLLGFQREPAWIHMIREF